jgi:hypothetical protein
MNAKMGFMKGEKGRTDGIVDITIGVEGKRRLEEILWRAKFEDLALDESDSLSMLGVKWRFILVDQQGREKSKL